MNCKQIIDFERDLWAWRVRNGLVTPLQEIEHAKRFATSSDETPPTPGTKPPSPDGTPRE